VEAFIGIIPTIIIIIAIYNNGWMIKKKKKITIPLETLAPCLIFLVHQDSNSNLVFNVPKEITEAAVGLW